MKVIINASIMVSGLVVLELNDGQDQGKVTVLNDKDFVYSTAQVLPGPGSTDEDVQKFQEDTDLRNVAILRLIARAHERMQQELENKGHVVVPQEVEKGRAN